jgi:hypothetical protein
MRRACLCVALLSSLLVAPNGRACGDKLVQVGRGVRYQRANSVRPASIVMFVSPAFDRRDANHLRSELAMVGHNVRVVESPAAFAAALADSRSDIVLTDVENLPVVDDQLATSAARPIVIPVIERSARVAAELQARFPFIMMLSAREFDHVSTINHAMK